MDSSFMGEMAVGQLPRDSAFSEITLMKTKPVFAFAHFLGVKIFTA